MQHFWAISTLIFIQSTSAWACMTAPVNIQFPESSFASHPVQVHGKDIRFLADTADESSMNYNSEKKQWCFTNKKVKKDNLEQACIKTLPTKNNKKEYKVNHILVEQLLLKDAGGRPYAEINLNNREMILTALDARGRKTEKQIHFVDESKKEEIKITVWGEVCLNAKFAGCAGGRAQISQPNPARAVASAKNKPAVSTINIAEKKSWSNSCGVTQELTQ